MNPRVDGYLRIAKVTPKIMQGNGLED